MEASVKLESGSMNNEYGIRQLSGRLSTYCRCIQFRKHIFTYAAYQQNAVPFYTDCHTLMLRVPIATGCQQLINVYSFIE
jgi:hypothetical protein